MYRLIDCESSTTTLFAGRLTFFWESQRWELAPVVAQVIKGYAPGRVYFQAVKERAPWLTVVASGSLGSSASDPDDLLDFALDLARTGKFNYHRLVNDDDFWFETSKPELLLQYPDECRRAISFAICHIARHAPGRGPYVPPNAKFPLEPLIINTPLGLPPHKWLDENPLSSYPPGWVTGRARRRGSFTTPLRQRAFMLSSHLPIQYIGPDFHKHYRPAPARRRASFRIRHHVVEFSEPVLVLASRCHGGSYEIVIETPFHPISVRVTDARTGQVDEGRCRGVLRLIHLAAALD